MVRPTRPSKSFEDINKAYVTNTLNSNIRGVLKPSYSLLSNSPQLLLNNYLANRPRELRRASAINQIIQRTKESIQESKERRNKQQIKEALEKENNLPSATHTERLEDARQQTKTYLKDLKDDIAYMDERFRSRELTTDQSQQELQERLQKIKTNSAAHKQLRQQYKAQEAFEKTMSQPVSLHASRIKQAQQEMNQFNKDNEADKEHVQNLIKKFDEDMA